MHYVVVPVSKDLWIWELREAAGRVVCRSASTHASHERALEQISELRDGVSDAGVTDGPEFDSIEPRAASKSGFPQHSKGPAH